MEALHLKKLCLNDGYRGTDQWYLALLSCRNDQTYVVLVDHFRRFSGRRRVHSAFARRLQGKSRYDCGIDARAARASVDQSARLEDRRHLLPCRCQCGLPG